MRHAPLAAAASASVMLLAAPSFAPAATFDFVSTLNGANERPTPTDSTGTGTATGTLDGEDGTWIFTYQIEYSGLTGPATLGHIHDAINPGGLPFTEQFGSPVHDLDSLESPISGDWRYDDAAQPLTDELADALLAGRMYINIHTEMFPGGEIRGQLVQVQAPPPPPPPPPPPGVIPLPAPVFVGMIGLAVAGASAWKHRRPTA